MTYCLQDDKVELRPLDSGYLRFAEKLRNEAEQIEGSYQVWPLSDDDQDDWWEKAKTDPTQKRFVVIGTGSCGLAIGSIALTHIDLQDGCAELGIRIAKEHWRKGYASAAIRLLTKWCFDEVRLHRLYSEVFACNQASMRLFEKCGWHLWGTKSYAHWQGGKWHDVLCYEIVEGRRYFAGGDFSASSITWSGEDVRYAGVRAGSEQMAVR